MERCVNGSESEIRSSEQIWQTVRFWNCVHGFQCNHWIFSFVHIVKRLSVDTGCFPSNRHRFLYEPFLDHPIYYWNITNVMKHYLPWLHSHRMDSSMNLIYSTKKFKIKTWQVCIRPCLIIWANHVWLDR